MDISKIKPTYDFSKNPHLNQKNVSIEFKNLLNSSRSFGSLISSIDENVRDIVFTDTLRASQGANTLAGGLAAASTWKMGSTLYIFINPDRKIIENNKPLSIGDLLLHEFSHHAPEVHGISNFDMREYATTVYENKIRESLGLPALPTGVRQSVPSGNNYRPDYFFGEIDNCFHASTQVLMADRTYKQIKYIEVDDIVLAYDPSSNLGRGGLFPKKVVNTFKNKTDE